MGTPDFAVPTLKKLYESKHEVVGVFTQTDKPKGRGYKLAPPPVKVLALEHGTPVYQPKSLKNEPQMWDELKKLEPDCIVVAAYGKILPREVPLCQCAWLFASQVQRCSAHTVVCP